MLKLVQKLLLNEARRLLDQDKLYNQELLSHLYQEIRAKRYRELNEQLAI